MTYEDQDLIAFLEGGLDAGRADEITRALETDDALARRVMALDPAREMVSDAFSQIAPSEGPALPAHASGRAPASLWRPLAIAASVVAVALLASNIWSATGTRWHQQVVAYQALYTDQTLSMIKTSDAGLAEQFAALDAALMIDFDAGDFADVDGLSLLRGQLLGFEGDPLGQIVFADHLGRPVALCLMAGGGEAGLVQDESMGLSTVSWGTGTHQFLLVGPVPAQELRGWAEALQPKV